MTSNSNTAYLQYWEDFSLLGKSMRRYAIATWISMGSSFFGYFIMQFALMIPAFAAMNSNSLDDPIAIIMGMIGIIIFFIIAALAISIYHFITHIHYLIQLKKVGEYTNDIDLQKAYKMEMWVLIISFITILIIIPGFFLFLFGGGFMAVFYMDERGLYGFMMLFLGFIIVSFIIVILLVTLQVCSVLAFDRWGQRIKIANYQNPYAGNIAEGTNFMKIGKIIAIFFGSIGTILFLIGFMKAGKGIIEFFDGYGNYKLSQGAAFPHSSNNRTLQQSGAATTTPNLNSSYMGNTTMKPKGEGFCSYCGAKLDDKHSIFCAICGRKLL